MKKVICFCLFLLAINFISTGNTYSKLNSSVSDSTELCIVSGEAIEGEGVKYTYLNKEVKFCCEGCQASFKKNPEKYLGSAALWCPVCNEGDASKDLSLVNEGVKYYFCGKGCKSKFSKDPDTYLNNYNNK